MPARDYSPRFTVKRLLVLTTLVGAVSAVSNIIPTPITLTHTKGIHPRTKREIKEATHLLVPANSTDVMARTALCVSACVVVMLEYLYSSLPKTPESRLLVYSLLLMACNVAYILSHHPQAWDAIFASLSAMATVVCITYPFSGRR